MPLKVEQKTVSKRSVESVNVGTKRHIAVDIELVRYN